MVSRFRIREGFFRGKDDTHRPQYLVPCTRVYPVVPYSLLAARCSLLAAQQDVRFISLLVQFPAFDGGLDGAAGFVGVGAGVEFAVLGKGDEFFEIVWEFVKAEFPEGEFAYAGGVDGGAAVAEWDNDGGRGCVTSLIVLAGDLANGLGDVADKVDDR